MYFNNLFLIDEVAMIIWDIAHIAEMRKAIKPILL
jgi:hypothetical protein